MLRFAGSLENGIPSLRTNKPGNLPVATKVLPENLIICLMIYRQNVDNHHRDEIGIRYVR
jgi:hypothetical protein